MISTVALRTRQVGASEFLMAVLLPARRSARTGTGQNRCLRRQREGLLVSFLRNTKRQQL